MTSRVTDDMKQQIVTMYPDVAPRDIAVELGIDVTAIYRVLREAGLRNLGQGGQTLIDRLSPADVEDIVAMYGRGDQIADICSTHVISVAGFYNLLHTLGIPPRRHTAEQVEGSKIQRDLAMEMYQERWVTWFITQETGLHQPQIHREIHRRGLPLRGRGKVRIPKKVDGKYIREDAEMPPTQKSIKRERVREQLEAYRKKVAELEIRAREEESNDGLHETPAA